MEAIDFHSPFFQNYMSMVEDTESPRLYHLWASVSAIACSLGRSVHFPMGVAGDIYPNHYILLVGDPAARKSTAMKVASRLLKDCTSVRFAPSDTGGQRQGLIRAMTQFDEAADALKIGRAHV